MIDLVQRQNDQVRRNAIKLGIRLLHGGNTAVQTAIMRIFEVTRYGPIFNVLADIIINLYKVQKDHAWGYVVDLKASVEETIDCQASAAFL